MKALFENMLVNWKKVVDLERVETQLLSVSIVIWFSWAPILGLGLIY